MDDNISGFGTQNPDPQLVGGPEIIPDNSASTQHRRREIFYKSSIEQSELEALTMMLAAEFPLLQSPEQNLTTSFQNLAANHIITKDAAFILARHVEETKHDIINSMWDAFIKRVEEMAELARKDDIHHWIQKIEASGGPKSAAEYYAFLMTMTVSQKAKEIDGVSALTDKFSKTFDRWIIAPLDQSAGAIINPLAAAPLDYPSSTFIAGALIVNADILHGPTAGSQISVSPVADALFAAGPSSGLPGDYQAAAALIAALLNGGAVYKATNDTVEEAAAGGGKPLQDLDFAKNYAKSILTIVQYPSLDTQPADGERAKQDNLIRLMLTIMALNMVYRAAYGGMAGEELSSLLAGNTDVHEDIKPLLTQLVGLINQYLPANPKERAEMLASLMDYVDNKHSVDSMLDITRMYKAYLSTDELDHRRFESEQG